jgi:hypothetical protein
MSPTTHLKLHPMRLLLAVCLVVAVATALPAGASAAAGFHMSRDFSANGDQGRAYGKHCGSSKYGDWRWRASIGSGYLRTSYRWIERVRPDGKARHLRFTSIGGPIVEEQPPALQDLFVASVSRVLNKITVRTVAGGAKLRYDTPRGGSSTIRFRPARGC